MAAHLNELTGYVAAHPHVGWLAVFAAALLESVALFGIFFPGSTLVFVGGVLIGLRVLDPVWTAAAAVSGAILGDGISYWLGHRFRDRIRTLGTFRRHAQLLDRSEAFLARHGSSSVFIGRFIGPLRSIVPVVAGMSDMPMGRFYVVNILSALAWAAANLVPGALFGASLQLAGAISSRLAVLLVLVVVAVWLLWGLARLAQSRLLPALAHGRDRMVAWARRGSTLPRRAVLAFFDPNRPESSVLLLSAVVLVASAWLFFGVLEDVLSRDPLVQFDQALFAALQSLRTEWLDALMVALTETGSLRVAIPVIIAVALLFALRRSWRTLAYWLGAQGVALVLVWVLKAAVGRVRPNAIYDGIEQFSFPSAHATSAIVLYGFLAYLLGRRQSNSVRIGLTVAAASLVALIAFSRLYLGAHWFSDVLGGLSFGLAWLALLAIAYNHHVRDERTPTLALAAVSMGALVLAAGWSIGERGSAEIARYRAHPAAETATLANWRDTGWHTLPAARIDFGGEVEEPLSLQWASTRQRLVGVLESAGWRSPAPWALDTLLLWLLPHPSIERLPVLPKLHQDRMQEIVMARTVDPRQRLVLRLWPSGHAADPDSTGTPTPLWMGIMSVEQLRHPAGAITIATTETDFGHALKLVGADLQSQAVATDLRDRDGLPVLLAW